MSLVSYTAAPAPFLTPIYLSKATGAADANPGTQASPKLTLAGLGTIPNNARIRLACGSTWTEELNLGAATGVVIEPYGSGAMPLIDLAVTLPGPYVQPNAGTYPNVWAGTVSLPIVGQGPNGNQMQLPLTIDGEQGNSVTSIAAVQAGGVGSYYEPSSQAYAGLSSAPIYFYAAANPNSDGHTYKVPGVFSAIVNSFENSGGLSISGIRAQNQGDNNGSMDLGINTVVDRCILKNGHKHHLLIESGVVRRSCFLKSTMPGGNSLIFYTNQPGQLNALADECHFLGQVTGPDTNNGTECHGGNYNYVLRRCSSRMASLADTQTATATLHGNYLYDLSPLPTAAYGGTIEMNLANITTDPGGGQAIGGAATTAQHNSFYVSTRGGGEFGMYRMAGSAVDFEHNSFVGGPGFSGAWIESSGLGPPPVIRFHFFSVVAPYGAAYQFQGVGPTSDYNVFWAIGGLPKFGIEASTNYPYANLAAYQAGTGQDAHSVYLLDADQVAAGAHAYWLGWSQAGVGTDLTTVGPAAGDFRVNPAAKVYKGDGTALIGTFADGTTPITMCGAQQHDDWNRRAVLPGPSLKFPNVPKTEADCVAFVASFAQGAAPWVY